MILKDVRNIDLSEYRKHLRESENIKTYTKEVLFTGCMFALFMFLVVSL